MNATELTPLLLLMPNDAEYFALDCVYSVTIHFTLVRGQVSALTPMVDDFIRFILSKLNFILQINLSKLALSTHSTELSLCAGSCWIQVK